MNIDFSIVIVTHNRPSLLRACIKSVESQACPELKQVIVVLNGCSWPKDLQVEKVSVLKIWQKKHLSPAAARNIAIGRVNSTYILFLDDDVVLPENYFSRSLKWLNLHGPEVFGGADTEYPNSGYFEKSINRTLMSPLVTASTAPRHSRKFETIFDSGECHLTLANLWVSTSLMQEFRFDPQFFRNEENELLVRAKPKKVIYCRDVWVHHKRRTKIFHILRSVFRSGFYRSLMLRKFGSSAGLIFFVPLLSFLFFLCVCAFWAPWGVALLFVYLVLVFLFSVVYGQSYFPLVFVLHLSINFSYMAGTFWGLCHNIVSFAGASWVLSGNKR